MKLKRLAGAAIAVLACTVLSACLSGCASSNFADQVQAAAKIAAEVDAGCTKDVDVQLNATGITPPTGYVHFKKTCDRTGAAAPAQ